jgi:hemin uptake protein HemP
MNDTNDQTSDTPTDPEDRRCEMAIVPKIRAEDLLGAHREVQIELDGVVYRLRMTRRKKLILQK